MWLGRSMQSLGAAKKREIDDLVANFFDRVSANPPPPPPPPRPPPTPHRSSEEVEAHAKLVERLNAHMEEHGLSQIKMAAALKLSSVGVLSLWLGRQTQSLSVAREREIDDLVSAYLAAEPAEGWAAQAQAAVSAARGTRATEHAEGEGDAASDASEDSDEPRPKRLRAVTQSASYRDTSKLCVARQPVAPPPGCVPPAASASKFPLGRIMQSADGSLWTADQERVNGATRSFWEYSGPGDYVEPEGAGWMDDADGLEAQRAEPCQETGLVTEAGGYRLHLSTWGAISGYKGVTPVANGKGYMAQAFKPSYSYLGKFDTAVEAAVAYAKHCAANEAAEGGADGETGAEKSSRATSAPQPTAGQPLPDGSYAVSFLVAQRHVGRGQSRRRQFRVRWVGYPPEEDTWEDESSILTHVLVENFERLRKGSLVASVLAQVTPSPSVRARARALPPSGRLELGPKPRFCCSPLLPSAWL